MATPLFGKDSLYVPRSSPLFLAWNDDTTSSSPAPAAEAPQPPLMGLYRPIAALVWKTLTDRYPSMQSNHPDPALQYNEAKPKGAPPGTLVKMETRVLSSSGGDSNNNNNSHSPIRYARMALLETFPPLSESDTNAVVHTAGIQVLNLVIFPHADTTLPVWGADFVSLPGDKHLLLLDAQPIQHDRRYEDLWQKWSETNEIGRFFPWGGDLPEQVQPFVSSQALWTRFVAANGVRASVEARGGAAAAADDDHHHHPIAIIQGPLVGAVEEHLQIYLQLLDETVVRGPSSSSAMPSNNLQSDYIRYRVSNDPARPMLKSLFGEEWTERVLSEVLFPTIMWSA